MAKYITKYELRWALIFSIFSILWAIIELELGLHTSRIEYHKYITLLFILPAGLIYYLFLIDKRARRYKRRFKFKHAFYSGLGLTFLIVLFTIPTQLLIHTLISPTYLEDAQKEVIKDGLMSVKAATRYLNIKYFILIFSILYTLLGVFFSLVFGLKLKRTKTKKKRYKATW